MRTFINKISLLLLMTTIVAGCGSSGGDSSVPNSTPLANAGRDLMALSNVDVVLDGSTSSDAEGDSLTYSWSMVTKPVGSVAALSNSTTITPVFTTDVPGKYTVSLVVNDGTSSSSPDTVDVTAISSVSHIRDTGQNDCYNNTAITPCPTIGEAFYGQDAQYSTNPLLFVDNSMTVSDSITGLTWQKIDDGIKYNWFQATGTADATYNPGGATDVCGSLSLGGFADWRLASRREMLSLVYYTFDPSGSPSFTYGMAEPSYFDSTGPDYWSSTESQVTNDAAWALEGGRVLYTNRGTNAFYARCVRGSLWGQNTYVDNGDGTITDTTSKLVWQQNDDAVARNWQSALAYCENLSLGGSSDWRLPDIKELGSLVTIVAPDETYYLPAISTIHFPTTQNLDYWSSTSIEVNPSYAWIVDFALGWIDTDGEKSGFKFTRCVR